MLTGFASVSISSTTASRCSCLTSATTISRSVSRGRELWQTINKFPTKLLSQPRAWTAMAMAADRANQSDQFPVSQLLYSCPLPHCPSGLELGQDLCLAVN